MSQTKKTYTLGKIKQLVDLNGDSTNFNLTFKVTCKDDTPFNLLVVDQTTLDNSPKLDYKQAKGTISGNIVADKNVFQNYFLILKSENPCVVDVELFKKELPITPVINKQQSHNAPEAHNYMSQQSHNVPESHKYMSQQKNMMESPRQKNMMESPRQKTNWLKIGLIVLVVVGGLVLLWSLYKRKPFEKNDIKFDDPPVFSNTEYKKDWENYTSPIKRTLDLSSISSSPIIEKNVYKSTPEYKSSSYKPKYTSPVRNSPDVMSNTSSFKSDAEGGTLLDRLKKHAR